MTVRSAFVGLSLAGLCVLALACTDAGRCVRGEPGCAPTKQGVCDNGKDDVDGICGELSDSDGGSGAGGTGATGPTRPMWRDPGPPPSVTCSGDTVEELCGDFCGALCENQARFCNDSSCTSAYCSENGELYKPCIDSCAPNGESDAAALECARSLCEAQIDETLTCETFGFLDRRNDVYETLCLLADPVCVQNPELGCSRTCGSDEGGGEDLIDNGRCEDGHPEDGEGVTRCPRGTDCGDCPDHPCTAPGGTCDNHGDCCGFFGFGALCARVEDGAPARCVSGCDDDHPCPDGFTCFPTDPISVCIEN